MSKFIIEVRTKGFGKAETELKRVNSQTRKFARESNNAGTASAFARKEVSKLRNNMLLVTFAMAGVTRGLGGFVKAASDAREQASQFNVVFGQFAPEAEAFAQSISDAFGIAKSEMVSLLAGLQDTLVPLGFTRKHASELSQSIAQLSLDVGSFKNIATGDVANRMTSALIGNHEAVRGLGISMTEATIRMEAMRLGIIDANSEMTQEAKILGRLALLHKGTSDAQGDHSRTQHEFANQLRGTQGRLLKVKEEIGESLLPYARLSLSMVNFMATATNAKIALGGLSVALGAYVVTAIRAKIATTGLTFAAMKNPFIIGATVLAAGVYNIGRAFGFFTEEAQDTAKEVKSLEEMIEELRKAGIDLSNGTNAAADASMAHAEAIKAQREAIDSNQDALRLKARLMEEETRLGKEAARVFITEGRMLTELEKNYIEWINTVEADIKMRKLQKNATRDYLEIMSKMNVVNSSSVDTIKGNVAAEEFRLDIVTKLGKALNIEGTALNALRSSLDINSVSLEENAQSIRVSSDTVMDFGEENNKLAAKILDTAKITIEYNNALAANEAQIRANEKAQEALKEKQNAFNAIYGQTLQGQADGIQATIDMINSNEELFGSTEKVQQVLALLNNELDALKNPEMAAAIDMFKTTFDGLESTQRANIQATMELILQNKEAFAVFGDVDLVLKQLKEDYDAVGESTKKTTKDMEDNFRKAAATINTMTAAIRVLKDEAADDDQQLKSLIQLVGSLMAQFGGPQGAAAGAVLNLGAELALGHTGGLIHNNGIQRFATGGMVQGQDNVPIMAQAGEFIIQRSAVQNIGVQNLAEMNRGGSAGNNVTVNISGNMIGNDEFVRDSLIPQLQKASKQNLA